MSGSLFIAAPPGVQWPLSLDDVEAFLRQRFPDAMITRETLATSGEPYLDFDVRFPDGMTRHGVYVERGSLMLSDGTPADWADTIAAFLALLPPGTPTAVMVEDEPVPVPLPEGTTTPDAIRELLESLG
ncbi:hypothetical protein [Planosporangium mesophilum]|uniref:Uncharacterized protein n=1 Tax=Planosporangium mesophilum TaxID=689768 RepID=A0A8J3X3W9_9ACTN|nr:hypothetical protein [Planosporangium mesophilum]NJC86818.1 hypothetical protein [Planosporangium mesophilum]GII26451.1 hypothetical protein Pme01_60480 [Planosporangium mesophilum]